MHKGISRAIRGSHGSADHFRQEVEKEGKAEFKIFGKTRTIDGFNKPTDKPESSRPPESSHTTAKTSTDSCPAKAEDKKIKRAGGRGDLCNEKYECDTEHTVTAPDVVVPASHVVKACDVAKYSQPCNHYASVAAKGARSGIGSSVFVTF